MEGKKVLVVSAHSADWIWRCGGTIAKYLAAGSSVYVLCLTFGARGESGPLWKSIDQTAEAVKAQRYKETMNAADAIGLTRVEMWDYDDCMLRVSDEIIQKANEKIREIAPDLIITHDESDNTNPDHAATSEIVFRAAVMATQKGVFSNGLPPVKSMPIYGFEPSETERSGYVPQIYIDVTDVYEKKEAAMSCVDTQKTVPEIHRRTNIHRGWQAFRMTRDSGIKYAESFSMRYALILSELPTRHQYK